MNTDRVLSELDELAEVTSDELGAQRVAWTPTWSRARDWLREKLAAIPCRVDVDAAGNLAATVPGTTDQVVMLGSHIDSVPDGGPLDGALGVVAGLEVLRTYAPGSSPVGFRLVDWADEEGARFGLSLFGSSAATGAIAGADVSGLRDAEGPIAAVVAAHGIDLDRLPEARRTLDSVQCYLELHIEQGPVLERAGIPTAVVTGTAGVERHVVRFAGEAAHAGAAPMDMRRDPVAAASRFICLTRDAVLENRALMTVGRLSVEPGVPTIVPGECEVVLDLRAVDAPTLAAVFGEAGRIARTVAEEAGVQVDWRPQFRIAPIAFDPELIDLAMAACRRVDVTPHVMASGALHDAAAVASVVPTVMLFAPTTNGISHSSVETADPADLAHSIRAFGELAHQARDWAATPER